MIFFDYYWLLLTAAFVASALLTARITAIAEYRKGLTMFVPLLPCSILKFSGRKAGFKRSLPGSNQMIIVETRPSMKTTGVETTDAYVR